jgi:hypothetical protein
MTAWLMHVMSFRLFSLPTGLSRSFYLFIRPTIPAEKDFCPWLVVITELTYIDGSHDTMKPLESFAATGVGHCRMAAKRKANGLASGFYFLSFQSFFSRRARAARMSIPINVCAHVGRKGLAVDTRFFDGDALLVLVVVAVESHHLVGTSKRRHEQMNSLSHVAPKSMGVCPTSEEHRKDTSVNLYRRNRPGADELPRAISPAEVTNRGDDLHHIFSFM